MRPAVYSRNITPAMQVAELLRPDEPPDNAVQLARDGPHSRRPADFSKCSQSSARRFSLEAGADPLFELLAILRARPTRCRRGMNRAL